MPDVHMRLSQTQQRFIFDENRYALFLGGVGAGKSHAGAVKAMLQVFPNQPALGMVIAPTYPMLRDATWRTAKEVWGPLIKSEVRNEMRMELVNGHEIIFRSADEPDRLRAINAAWMWLDEGAMCHPDTWPIAIGRLRQHGVAGRAWVTTTPKGMNWLYTVFVVNATPETVVYRASTRSNPFLETDYVESLATQYEGEFARQELDAEFIADNEAALIAYQWIEDARSKEAAYAQDGGPLVAGIDVAGPGKDETVCGVRQGPNLLDVRWTKQDDPLGAVLDFLRPFVHKGLSTVNVDAIGIGYNFIPRLQEVLGETVTVAGVNVAEKATTPRAQARFYNLKAELYWSLRERFQGGEIAGITDPVMISQLAGVQYEYKGGRTMITPKDDGVKSPDRAEALMLTFAPAMRGQRLAAAYQAAAKR